MSVNDKLLAVQSELKAPKGQYNSFGKYKYRSCEDILEAVKPILKKNNSTLRITDEVVLIGERFYIKATAIFTDVETCESVQCCAWANESESHKGMTAEQITGTASSYARKYCLNGLFLIDDTKDADTDAYKVQQDKADQKQVITSDDGHVRYINGCDVQIKAKNNKWYGIEVVKTEQLQSLLEKEEYAAAKDAIEAELMARSVQP